MDFELRTNAKHVGDKELLEDLKRVVKLLGKEFISQTDYDLKGNFAHKNYYKRFGSWNKALQKAGLPIIVSKTISNEELFNNLEKIWLKLGRQPFYSEIRKPLSKYAVDTYCRRFGSWFKACESFIHYKKKDLKFIKLAKLKNTGRTRAINERLRLQVFKRDNFACRKCGRSPATHIGTILHLDHIVPFSKGGNNNLENLETLCNKCNLGKGDLETV